MKQFILFALLLVLSDTLLLAQGSGKALRFDGSSDYVAVANIGPSVANSDFTVCAWIKSTSGSGNQSVVAFNPGSRPDFTNDNRILLYVTHIWDKANGANAFFTKNLRDGLWHHIALTLDVSTNTLQVYLDGVADISVSTTTEVQSGDIASIGQEWDLAVTSGHFGGDIDEVSIWNRKLSQTEIRNWMCEKLDVASSGLVGYWNFDEGVDNTCDGIADVCDLTGNGHHGTKF